MVLAPASATTSGSDPGAAAGPPGEASLYFYRVAGLCGDGLTEGPW